MYLCFGLSLKRNYVIFNFLIYFAEQDDFKFHPFSGKQPDFILLNNPGCVFDPFSYPFICGWASKQFPECSYHELYTKNLDMHFYSTDLDMHLYSFNSLRKKYSSVK